MASLYRGVADRTSPRKSMRIICDFDGAITRQDGIEMALKLIDVRQRRCVKA
jgi:hypothetical protein